MADRGIGYWVKQGWNRFRGVDDVDDDGTPDALQDSDRDGLSDAEERRTYGTDPHDPDSDGDGESDGAETKAGTSPTDELDNSRPDSDGDGVPNVTEEHDGTDPHDQDSDDDGLTDGFELRAGTDPLDPDSDNDGTPDGEEDTDSDGVVNADEQDQGTSPIRQDSDFDGVMDDGRPLEEYVADLGDGLDDILEAQEEPEPEEAAPALKPYETAQDPRVPRSLHFAYNPNTYEWEDRSKLPEDAVFDPGITMGEGYTTAHGNLRRDDGDEEDVEVRPLDELGPPGSSEGETGGEDEPGEGEELLDLLDGGRAVHRDVPEHDRLIDPFLGRERDGTDPPDPADLGRRGGEDLTGLGSDAATTPETGAADGGYVNDELAAIGETAGQAGADPGWQTETPTWAEGGLGAEEDNFGTELAGGDPAGNDTPAPDPGGEVDPVEPEPAPGPEPDEPDEPQPVDPSGGGGDPGGEDDGPKEVTVVGVRLHDSYTVSIRDENGDPIPESEWTPEMRAAAEEEERRLQQEIEEDPVTQPVEDPPPPPPPTGEDADPPPEDDDNNEGDAAAGVQTTADPLGGTDAAALRGRQLESELGMGRTNPKDGGAIDPNDHQPVEMAPVDPNTLVTSADLAQPVPDGIDAGGETLRDPANDYTEQSGRSGTGAIDPTPDDDTIYEEGRTAEHALHEPGQTLDLPDPAEDDDVADEFATPHPADFRVADDPAGMDALEDVRPSLEVEPPAYSVIVAPDPDSGAPLPDDVAAASDAKEDPPPAADPVPHPVEPAWQETAVELREHAGFLPPPSGEDEEAAATDEGSDDLEDLPT
ncbi:MAG: hypothetical protein AAFZ07_02125 [Actinomycetota bacterium]